jgi:hypothetical protein
VYIFSNTSFQLEAQTDNKIKAALEEYQYYKIDEFGHRQRDKLIEKWVTIGKEDTIVQSEINEKKVLVSRVINTAIGENFIPKYPLYLLAILQAIEVGKTSSLQGSAYGHYYEFLITQSLGESKVTQEELDFYFSFLSDLAYYCFDHERLEFNDEEFQKFHYKFCEKKAISVREGNTINVLLRSRILNQNLNYFKFSHHYLFYFFVAKYLSDNIDKDITKKTITEMSKRLYRTEFANIIIFLLHHTKKPYILELIINEAKKVFSDVAPNKFTKEEFININNLIRSDIKFRLENKTPEEIREKKLKKQDEIEDNGNNQTDIEEFSLNEEVAELNMFSKINLSLKLIEILGQIAKNYYASLDGDEKIIMLEQGYLLGLRSLNAVLQEIESNVDSLYNDIKTTIEQKNIYNKEKIYTITGRIVFGFATLISATFITRTAKSVSSDKLITVLERIFKNKQTIGIKLINLGAKLDLPDKLDIQEIKNFNKEIKGNHIAKAILNIIVLNHLHSFNVEQNKKAKICGILGIDHSFQQKFEINLPQELLKEKN